MIDELYCNDKIYKLRYNTVKYAIEARRFLNRHETFISSANSPRALSSRYVSTVLQWPGAYLTYITSKNI